MTQVAVAQSTARVQAAVSVTSATMQHVGPFAATDVAIPGPRGFQGNQGVVGPSGPAGPQGLPGATALIASVVAGEALLPGAPVVIDRGSKRLLRADAANPLRSLVIGVTSAAVQIGFVASVVTGRVILTDWTALAGSAALTPGSAYFLAVGGGITASIPDVGRGFVAAVALGIAADPQTLVVAPSLRILL